jgi:enolase-phosphatase E1
LTPLISGYFDTTTGPKLEPQSYRSIAGSLALPGSAIVFLSDHPGETAAAAKTGMQSVLLVRGDSPAAVTQPSARSFNEIDFIP